MWINSFDTIAESIGELDTKIDKNTASIDKNTELIQDNANISKTILNIVKNNSERLDQYGNVLKQIPEMYEWFKDIKDDLGKWNGSRISSQGSFEYFLTSASSTL